LVSSTEYEVSSFVQIASDVEVNYRVLYNVSGWMGEKDKRMTAKEVRKRLRGMEYMRDEGDFNVIAEGKVPNYVWYQGVYERNWEAHTG